MYWEGSKYSLRNYVHLIKLFNDGKTRIMTSLRDELSCSEIRSLRILRHVRIGASSQEYTSTFIEPRVKKPDHREYLPYRPRD